MNSASHYDVAIIGAGMSGLAAGIRLAHFGKRVCIFERHNAPGGLNSFYSIAGRKYDVGLHAMTNFVPVGVKGTPLTKLLRQLRIQREEFALCPQIGSRVAFGSRGEIDLRFTNDFSVLESDIAAKFPAQIDGFRALTAVVRAHDDVALDAPLESARAVLRRHITDPLLEDMLLCPLMYYGSATERDMEFTQFVTMFKAVFLEGFSRPLEGVRLIIRVLLEKYRAAGGERRMKCGVQRIVARGDEATAIILDNGEEVTAGHIISSVGAPETAALINSGSQVPGLGSQPPPAGRLSFTETITVLNCQPSALGWGADTIVFFNDSERFDYAQPQDAVDLRSGVICFPNNFQFGGDRTLADGLLRVTCLANYDQWVAMRDGLYEAMKRKWFDEVHWSARRFLPPVTPPEAVALATVATDMFTPRTITHFTGHLGGAVYGSPRKYRTGQTALRNVYLCGTDQGFLGIVGAMLSGISMANYHILQKG